MKKIKAKIVIIGAGPAGMSTALFLSKYGIKSYIIEKSEMPREKICGDAQGRKVINLLNELDNNIIKDLCSKNLSNPSWGIIIGTPSGKKINLPYYKDYNTKNTPPSIVTKRIDFDNYLFENLIKPNKDITIISGTSIDRIEKCHEGYSLFSDKKQLNIIANLIIGADGANSILARKILNIPVEKKHYSTAITGYYKNITNLSKNGFLEIYFIKDFLPGYFWIFPLKNNEANVGVGMRSDVIVKNKINLKQTFFRIIEKDPIFKERFKDAKIIRKPKGFRLPLASKYYKIFGDNYLLVGDAAHLIDPFTGEGVANAILSGKIAAQTIASCCNNNNFNENNLAKYQDDLLNVLQNEFESGVRLQKLLNKPKLFSLLLSCFNNEKILNKLIFRHL